MDIAGIVYSASTWVLPVLFAVTLHEAAHGWVAWKLGDDTAYRAGRVTFNPIKHIDLFGTILLPAMLLLASGGRMMFGAAKPVPVSFWRLRNVRRDTILVAAAGPGTNLILAVISMALLAFLLPAGGPVEQWVIRTLGLSVWFNILLAVFNMLPLPPLDGSRVVMALLPYAAAERYMRLERWGFAIIIAALFVLPWLGGMAGMDLNIFWWLIGNPSEAIMRFLGGLFGLNLRA